MRIRFWLSFLIPCLVSVAACGFLEKQADPVVVGRLMTEALYNPDGVAPMAAALPEADRRAAAKCLARVHAAAVQNMARIAEIDAAVNQRMAAAIPGSRTQNSGADFAGILMDSDIALTAIVAPQMLEQNESYAFRKWWWSMIDATQVIADMSLPGWNTRQVVTDLRPLQEGAYTQIAATVCK